MTSESDKNASVPSTNRELFASRFAGADAFFALCQVTEPSPGVQPQEWTLRLLPDDPVLPNRQRKEFAAQFQDGGLRTLGVGSLLWVKQAGSPDRMPLLERNGPVQDTGKWTQPSGLTTSAPLVALLRETIEESGLIATDHENKSVTVFVPDCSGIAGEFSKAAQQVDGLAIKRQQEPNIRVALAAKGMSEYRIVYQLAAASLREAGEPSCDQVSLSWPSLTGTEETKVSAYVVKDRFGSINVHVPLEMELPASLELDAIECEKFGRTANMVTAERLTELCAADKVTNVLKDYLARRDGMSGPQVG